MADDIERKTPESEPASRSTDNDEEPAKPGIYGIIAASVFMALPAAIPFYYAFQSEGTMKLVLFAFGIGVVIVNSLILVMVYRWILRMMS